MKGWFSLRPVNPERVAFILQRVTGIGIMAYFVAHVFTTGDILMGKDAWQMLMETLNEPLAHVGMLLLLAGIGFHTINGLRLILAEFGFILGRPKRPDYPYIPTSLNRVQRGLLILAAMFSGLAMVLGWLFIFGGY